MRLKYLYLRSNGRYVFINWVEQTDSKCKVMTNQAFTEEIVSMYVCVCVCELKI